MVDDQDNGIIGLLKTLQSRVASAPGHSHLYEEFNVILTGLASFRAAGGMPTAALASEILAAVDILLKENGVGRRPWAGAWEEYFGKCMEDACRLLNEFSLFGEFDAFLPVGYCNQFLDAFGHMDQLACEYEATHPSWSRHFADLALRAAKMFSLVADQDARIEMAFLENPNDAVFTSLLTGYAKARTAEANKLLQAYVNDKDAWVRELAVSLLAKHFGD